MLGLGLGFRFLVNFGELNVLFGGNYRPFSDEELRSNAPQVVTCNDFQREVAVSQTIAGKQIDRVFTFDKVIDKEIRVSGFDLVKRSRSCHTGAFLSFIPYKVI